MFLMYQIQWIILTKMVMLEKLRLLCHYQVLVVDQLMVHFQEVVMDFLD